MHAMLLAPRQAPHGRVVDVINSHFPGSIIKDVSSLKDAQKLIQTSVFDLVVLMLPKVHNTHGKLFDAIRKRPTGVPVLILLGDGVEEELHEKYDTLPAIWECCSYENLSPTVLARRIMRAIENHQKQWELEHLQKAFQSSLIQFRHLFDQVPDLIFTCDRAGCLLDVNATTARMFGASKETMILQPICDVFGLEREDFEKLIEGAVSTKEPLSEIEIEYHPPHGPVIIGRTHLVPVQNIPGRPQHFQGIIKDVSPRKTMERQLQLSEDRYKTLYEMAQVCSSSLRLDEISNRSLSLIRECIGCKSIALLLNTRFEELNLVSAYSFPDELFQKYETVRPPILGQDLIGRWAMTSGMHKLSGAQLKQAHHVIYEWVQQSGKDTLVGCTLALGNTTVPNGIVLFPMDQDEADELSEGLINGLSKTLEMGLTNCFHYANSQDAEKRYRELWEHAPAMFISTLKGGEIFEVNKIAAQSLSYHLPDLIGHPFTKFVAQVDRRKFEAHHKQLISEGQPQDYEIHLVKQNGIHITVSIKSEPIFNSEGAIIGAKSVLNDITRNKELEARLRDYADNLQKMVQERTDELTSAMNFLNGILEGSTEYAIIALDGKGKFLHFNHGAQLLFGYDTEEMVNKQDLSYLIRFEGNPADSLDAFLNEVDEQGVVIKEIKMHGADGTSMTCLLTMNKLKPLPDQDLNFVAIVRDISAEKELEELLKLYTENLQQVIEQKTRELENQHIQLIQSSKLATLGEMATGIAHEMNQPLSGIRTRAQLICKAIERKMVSPEHLSKTQNEIIGLVDRISTIIKHMRVFARQDQQRFTSFQLVQSLDGAMNLIGEQLRIHGIELVLDIGEQLPPVVGEQSQIEQVIINLLSNARDACDQRGEIERKAGTQYKKQISIQVYEYDDEMIAMDIGDNGTGMDEQVRAKIFEPFFTTKPVGQGTGLGMSISYGIIANHKGTIECISKANEGTTFRILLPQESLNSSEIVEMIAPE